MRGKRCVLGLGLIFSVGIFFFAAPVLGDTILVPGDEPTIQAGIDAAVDGDVVTVADGIYTGAGNKNLNFNGKAITVMSENGPWDCAIDCQGAGRGFIFDSGEGEDSVVLGFGIINGNKQRGGGIYCTSSSSPTIAYCVIAGNRADYGGGVYCDDDSAPTIADCLIWYNDADLGGGGVYCRNSSPSIIECIIDENWSYHNGGGGIYCSFSNAVITNCTFTNNAAFNNAYGGAICCSMSSPIITNCILWDDSPYEIHTHMYSVANVNYCDVQGGYEGEGNIDEDPLFLNPSIGDYRLPQDSPCVDAGDNSAVPPYLTGDIDGRPRIADGDGDGTAIVDMGVHEYPPDTDDDFIPDYWEDMTCTDPLDADTDDDGILDGLEDVNGNGVKDLTETDPCNIDTDGDGVQDGTESRVTLEDIDPSHTDTSVFQPDFDPTTGTNPLRGDTDRDGLLDGEEDLNGNGRVDPGETDPNDHLTAGALMAIYSLLL